MLRQSLEIGRSQVQAVLGYLVEVLRVSENLEQKLGFINDLVLEDLLERTVLLLDLEGLHLRELVQDEQFLIH